MVGNDHGMSDSSGEAAASSQQDTISLEDFEPAEVYELKDLEQLRTTATPLRMRILSCLQDRPRTIREVGRILSEESTRLYYHAAELERVGLIRLVGMQQDAGVVRKYYRAVAHFFRLPPALLQENAETEGGKAWADFVAGCLSIVARELQLSYQQGVIREHSDRVELRHLIGRLPEPAARAMVVALENLAEMFELFQDDSAATPYSLLLAMFPRLDRETDEEVPSDPSPSR